MSSEAARHVRSVYLADPGARDALRARWPALAMALDELAGAAEGLLSRDGVAQISDRWRESSPWAAGPPAAPKREG